ncbi:MAG: HD-GYP domain-containing protein [Chloroflexota bacterium]|jgi:putative two-component system response regulator
MDRRRRRGTAAPRPRILCVDDEPVTLRLVERLLEKTGCEVVTVDSAIKALAVFDVERFDLVLTDVRMPEMDGLAFLAAVRKRDEQMPIVVATGHATVDNAIEALREGATGMLMKPYTGQELIGEVERALERSRIRHEAIQYRFVTPILDGVALALSAAIEARDIETGAHCRQLGVLGERVAQLLGLPEQDRTTIRIGGYLHDVGKIAIADRILLKPDALTDEEYRAMQQHSELGAAIVSTHAAMGGIARIVRHHHERWDGSGYPDRLVGREIPLGARIICVADAFSAMTSDRVYRRALNEADAWEELRRQAGRQFDPSVVEVFEAAALLDDEPGDEERVPEGAATG